MEPARETIEEKSIRSGGRDYLLTLTGEDFSSLYPGMLRYTLAVREGESERAIFRTNTFEYSSQIPLTAGTVARDMAAAWERELLSDPEKVFSAYPPVIRRHSVVPPADVVILQGSPRPDGNCSILATWVEETLREAGHTSRIIYPHDLDIHCCIGCYQCYNTGTCVFDDDMTDIIAAVGSARILIVCSPVYTNTVPAGLKLVIDRMQAYHAERMLLHGRSGQKGILLSVAGCKGARNFTCITNVIIPFFQNLGIEPTGQMLIDSTDTFRDVPRLTDRRDEVRDFGQENLLWVGSGGPGDYPVRILKKSS